MLFVSRIKCVVLYLLSHPMNDHWSLLPWVSNKCRQRNLYLCSHGSLLPIRTSNVPQQYLCLCPTYHSREFNSYFLQKASPDQSHPEPSVPKESYLHLSVLSIFHYSDLTVTQQIIHLFTLGPWLSRYLQGLAHTAFTEWLLKRMLWFRVSQSLTCLSIFLPTSDVFYWEQQRLCIVSNEVRHNGNFTVHNYCDPR